MKTILALVLTAACLFGAGCASTAKNFSTFLANMPAVTATDITQSTTTPVYSHTESASGVVTTGTGLITITNGRASASVPELGVNWNFSVSGLVMGVTALQRENAEALKARAAAASAPPDTAPSATPSTAAK